MGGAGRGKQQKKKRKPVHSSVRRTKGRREREQAAERAVAAWAGVERLTPGLFDLHTHSTFSDGLLSPELLVARAHRNGVRVLALTDHDTLAGVPAAVQAGRRHGVRVIPGVEISAKNVTRTHGEESVHILAYFGSCGPSNWAPLGERLKQVREGRYRRAEKMVEKLRSLHKPITLEQVVRIAGEGVAPARPHIARALLEAGHVHTVGEAFTKYLRNDGPAYATGAELPAVEAVGLIRQAGGIAVLAHPWALKDPIPLIERLKKVGLDAMEVYRGDGKFSAFSSIAEACKLVKLGGSDYHATGNLDETDLGGVALPALVLHEFLTLAEPVWSSALEQILGEIAGHNLPTEERSPDLGVDNRKDTFMTCSDGEHEADRTSLTLRYWLSKEETRL